MDEREWTEPDTGAGHAEDPVDMAADPFDEADQLELEAEDEEDDD